MFFLCPVVLCPQVTLIHSKMALADTELLPCVRQEVKEILLRKGVQLLLSTCKAPPARPLSPAEVWSLPTVRVRVAALSPGSLFSARLAPCPAGGVSGQGRGPGPDRLLCRGGSTVLAVALDGVQVGPIC